MDRLWTDMATQHATARHVHAQTCAVHLKTARVGCRKNGEQTAERKATWERNTQALDVVRREVICSDVLYM